jgi:hypothetical protein
MIGSDAPIEVGVDDLEVAIEQRREELRLLAGASDDGSIVQLAHPRLNHRETTPGSRPPRARPTEPPRWTQRQTEYQLV